REMCAWRYRQRGVAVIEDGLHPRREAATRRDAARRAEGLADQDITSKGALELGIPFHAPHEQSYLVLRQLPIEQRRHLFENLICHWSVLSPARASGFGRSPRGPGKFANERFL